VFFWPKRAPEYNPDEQVWNEVKNNRIGKQPVRTGGFDPPQLPHWIRLKPKHPAHYFFFPSAGPPSMRGVVISFGLYNVFSRNGRTQEIVNSSSHSSANAPVAKIIFHSHGQNMIYCIGFLGMEFCISVSRTDRFASDNKTFDYNAESLNILGCSLLPPC